MKIIRRRPRLARKLILPLVALAMMTTMMSLEASNRAPQSGRGGAPAAASVSIDLLQR